MTVKLASCVYPSVSSDYADCEFIKPDGSSLESYIFSDEHDVELKVGEDYRVMVIPIFVPDTVFGPSRSATDPVEWLVWEGIAKIESINQEQVDE